MSNAETAGIPGEEQTAQEAATPMQEKARAAENAEQQKEIPAEERLQSELKELGDRYLRIVAEYDNYRKRTQKERDDIYPAATAKALTSFLPVLDNLDRAEQYDPGTEDFKKGFDMICKGIREIMTGFGVEEIGEVGEAFDPERHHAVMHIEDDSLGENVIAMVLQKGYKMGERVLRCAMVQTAN